MRLFVFHTFAISAFLSFRLYAETEKREETTEIKDYFSHRVESSMILVGDFQNIIGKYTGPELLPLSFLNFYTHSLGLHQMFRILENSTVNNHMKAHSFGRCVFLHSKNNLLVALETCRAVAQEGDTKIGCYHGKNS